MRKVVYSCLFSNGTKQIDQPYVSESDKLKDFDYVMFTNVPDNVKNTGWSAIYMEILNNHPIYTAKYYKWTAHNYLLDYDIAIYVDAYMSPNSNSNPKIMWDDYIYRLNTVNISEGIMLMKHSQRDCIYDECNTIVRCKKDTRENMDKVITFLKENNMPVGYGLSEGGLILRHLKNDKLNSFLEEFFNLMLKYTYRDQALLSYMFWKNDIPIKYEFTHNFYNKTGKMGNHNYT